MALPQSTTTRSRIRRAILVATPRGEILFATGDAKRWIRDFFGRPARAAVLPGKVFAWLTRRSQASGHKTLISRRNNQCLFIRISGPHPEEAIALTLEFVAIRKPVDSRRIGPLTARQTEVLTWVVAGKSNPEIAIILELAVGTVGKHRDAIFARLGVENRTAAALAYAMIASVTR